MSLLKTGDDITCGFLLYFGGGEDVRTSLSAQQTRTREADGPSAPGVVNASLLAICDRISSMVSPGGRQSSTFMTSARTSFTDSIPPRVRAGTVSDTG